MAYVQQTEHLVRTPRGNVFIDKGTAMDQGAQAFRKGLDDWNPFERETPDWWKFLAGWQLAEAEFRDKHN